MIRSLAGLAFVQRAENVILLGPPGVGKTHLAIALGVKAAEAGHRVLFLTLEEVMNRLKRAQQEKRLERQLQQLTYLSGPGRLRGTFMKSSDFSAYHLFMASMGGTCPRAFWGRGDCAAT